MDSLHETAWESDMVRFHMPTNRPERPAVPSYLRAVGEVERLDGLLELVQPGMEHSGSVRGHAHDQCINVFDACAEGKAGLHQRRARTHTQSVHQCLLCLCRGQGWVASKAHTHTVRASIYLVPVQRIRLGMWTH